MNKKIMICSMAAGAALLLSACSTNNESTKETTDTFVTESSTAMTTATESTTDKKVDEDKKMDKQLQLRIGNEILSVDWEENESVNALRNLVKDEALTVNMSMYGGFEQVGELGATLPSNDARTTTGPGDIVLYSGDSIVIFYGSNSWAYTKLGKITGKTDEEIKNMLGNGDVSLMLEMK